MRTLLVLYPKRVILGFTLMSAQAFFYNAIFFTYARLFTSLPRQRYQHSLYHRRLLYRCSTPLHPVGLMIEIKAAWRLPQY